MNDPGPRRPPLLVDVVHGSERTRDRQPARLRVGIMMAVTATSLVAVAGISALSARPATNLRTVSAVQRPTQQPSGQQATPAATPPVTFAHQLIVGPGVTCCFVESGQWSAAAGGVPGFKGADRWIAAGTAAGAGASAHWSLGNPTSGQRWDQVRVQVWIPNMHGLAWVRYTVISTNAGVLAVQTFDVSQHALNGWYTLPGTFAIGTPTLRTGTITVGMTYLRSFAGVPNGCEMAAAQVQFEWS